MRPKSKSWFYLFSISLLLSLWNLDIVQAQTSVSTLARYGHCTVTYNETLYVFGGWDNNTDTNGVNNSPFFYSITLPFNVSNQNWTRLNTTNAISVGDAACVSTPSGYLLVFGGILSPLTNEPTNITTQIYDLNNSMWLDYKNFFASPYLGYGRIPGPRAALISQSTIAVYAGYTGIKDGSTSNVPIQILYFLNITSKPWYWTQVVEQDSVAAPLSRVITSAKGDLWALGGYYPNTSIDNSTIFVSNRRHQWVSSDNIYFQPGFREGAVGICNNMMYVIAFASFVNETSPTRVFSLDMTSMKPQISTAYNETQSRYLSSFAQFPGSDAFIVFGGVPFANLTPQYNNPLSEMLIFNMTTQTFTSQLNIRTDIPVDNFTLPPINGTDMNANNRTRDLTAGSTTRINNNPSPTSNNSTNETNHNGSNNKRPTIVIIAVVIVGVLVILSIIFLIMCTLRKQKRVQRSFHVSRPTTFPLNGNTRSTGHERGVSLETADDVAIISYQTSDPISESRFAESFDSEIDPVGNYVRNPPRILSPVPEDDSTESKTTHQETEQIHHDEEAQTTSNPREVDRIRL